MNAATYQELAPAETHQPSSSLPANLPSISLVIPCWTDWPLALELCRKANSFPFLHEIIVALPPGSEATVAPFKAAGARVVHAEKVGRGSQMNAGAAVATGDILLFHHCDSILAASHLASLAHALFDPKLMGGAFHRAFDERHPHLRWLEPWERLHCNLFGTLYGDQSLFARRSHFEKMGGFADLPLMEDVEFSRRLRRLGGVIVLDPPMATSPRKHLQNGSWRTTLQNMKFLILFSLGVPAKTLHARYYASTLKQTAEQNG